MFKCVSSIPEYTMGYYNVYCTRGYLKFDIPVAIVSVRATKSPHWLFCLPNVPLKNI